MDDVKVDSPLTLASPADAQTGLTPKSVPGSYPPELIDDLFTYHAPTTDQIPCYEHLRAAARVFARVLVANVPPCADRTAAMRHLRECVMTANAAIARQGRPS